VSVTQQFNTTTSMGRLTLNVLLSFAQFEREVTSERIRDKIAASKRKGLWVGGMIPLGYELKDGKLMIVETEAELVRTIFRRYLELGSVNRLSTELRDRNVRSKIRTLSNGKTRGGVRFTQGPLFYILRNRFYVGEVRFKDETCPGPQPALMDRGLFDAVQARLTQQWSHRTVTRSKSCCLLSGLLFDDAGHPMVATHATKNRVRYRYYVSQPMLRGRARLTSGSVSRVPAADIETAVTAALTKHLGNPATGTAGIPNGIDRNAVVDNIAHIEVRKDQLAVRLRRPAADGSPDQDTGQTQGLDQNDAGSRLLIPWCKPPSKKARELLLPASAPRDQVRPIKAERRVALIKSIARGRAWLDEIVSGAASGIEEIAERNKCSPRHVNMTISMAFIAPALVKAAIEGRLPRGIGVANLRDAPAEWPRQFERLGLSELD
jgi:site-specific DNA recombinase